MNLLFNKTTFVIFFLVALCSACKKDKSDPEPDVAQQASGTYTFSALETGGVTYPASQTTIKGTVKLTRSDANTIDVDFDIRQKQTNAEFMVGNFSDITVSKGSNNEIDLFYDGERAGFIKENKIHVFGSDEEDEEFTLIATK